VASASYQPALVCWCCLPAARAARKKKSQERDKDEEK
jgi:hypothetical protein